MIGLPFFRVLLGLLGLSTAAWAQTAAQFYVAVDGNDAGDGTMPHPFATLERARSAVRLAPGGAKEGATVFLRGGTYQRTETFELGAEDSGADGQPVIYRSYPGETARLVGGRKADDLIALHGASEILLEDLSLEESRGRLLVIEGGSENLVRHCTLRDAGRDGAEISGAKNGLDHCTVTDVGDSAVRLAGGIRATLAPGGNFLRDCTIRRFSRRVGASAPGVRLAGVGQIVANNLFTEAPRAAIVIAGNNHRIESNEISHVGRLTGEAGAIYGGRRWDYRGNKIRHNFIHDLTSSLPGYGKAGVYLGDCLSGNEVSGNIFYRVSGPAVRIGGGRDNLVVNNLMVECGAALTIDARGLKQISHQPGKSWNLLERLHDDGVDYQAEPWKSAYPQLAAMPDDWAQLSAPGALWLAPIGNVFERNVGFRNRTFIANRQEGGSGAPDRWLTARDNLANSDPQFVDEAKLNLALKASSPAEQLPGFQPIPFNGIGPH